MQQSFHTPSQPPPLKHEVNLIVGGVGSGKTSLLLYLAESLSKTGKYYVIYHSPIDPREPAVNEVALDYESAMESAQEHDNVVLALDEGHVYASQKIYKDEFNIIAMWRRHIHFSLLMSTQRPQFIKSEIRDLLNTCYIFRCHGRALVWLDENFEFEDQKKNIFLNKVLLLKLFDQFL